ncbi:MAG: c-type cytochrome [Deltaproteobacteria bacterium]|nr:c-type cytochrome [Deltaproteobacteria bacterium]
MSPSAARCSVCRFVLWALLLLLALAALGAAIRFLSDRPVTYDDPVEHFKYGSTGGERNMGFPYWLWQVLPEVCPDLLPGKGYASLGFIFEQGRDLPVGMSKRRHMGIDRVFLNCAVCHTATVRTSPNAQPMLVAGMPANQLDLMRFQKFVQACVNDRRFTPAQVVPRIEEKAGGLGLLDQWVVYPLSIHLMRDGVAGLLGRLRFIHQQADWGPGRVDTFNSAKAIFGVPFELLQQDELIGVSDFPAIWNQAKKQGMQLHWDGNNSRVEERNLSAAFGTGATPKLIDHAAIARIEAWIATAVPPVFEKYYPVDRTLAARGKALYQQTCAACHGQSGSDFSGEYVGTVTPIGEIGTDRGRLDSYTLQLAQNQGMLYSADPDRRFRHFRKTYGYANAPLDGIWLRAPYLHNGSVPTLWDLLQPAAQRPKMFYRGNDLYDPRHLGFVADPPAANDRPLFAFDTTLPGNGNAGHEGAAYGTTLPDADKWALLEYLKTF